MWTCFGRPGMNTSRREITRLFRSSWGADSSTMQSSGLSNGVVTPIRMGVHSMGR
jgi:hypothetical protein